MIEIPKIPDKEELEFREKAFILSIREQLQSLNRSLVYALVAVAIAAIPLGLGLRFLIAGQLIRSYDPPVVNTDLYNPKELEVVDAGFVPVVRGVYSGYAQVLNPNTNLAAWEVVYRFVFSDSSGQVLAETAGSSYIDRGQSKFFVAPKVELGSAPTRVNLEIDGIRWTGIAADIEIGFDVLQQNSGITEEGNFFVEAEVRNRQDFRLKKVQVEVIVFDTENQKPLAVNSTSFSDLEAFENRYFRVLWPEGIANTGLAQVIPSVNPLDTGAVLEEQEGIPAR